MAWPGYKVVIQYGYIYKHGTVSESYGTQN